MIYTLQQQFKASNRRYSSIF